MTGLLIQAFLLIVDSLAGFFSILLMLRFFMQVFRVPFGNQAGSFVLTLTSWLVMPLRRAIPPLFGLDMASLAGAFLLQALALTAAITLHSGLEVLSPGATAVLILVRSLLAILRISIYLLIGLLIAQAILSWFNPHSPLHGPIQRMTQPFLQPLRRIVPPVSNIDLTPLIAILLAQIVLIFL